MARLLNQFEFFKEIWSERDHISFLSNRPIKYFDVKSFAHILPKGKFTKYKYNKDNIILLLPEEHTLLDQGTEKQRVEYSKKWGCNWDKIYMLREHLIKLYYDSNKS